MTHTVYRWFFETVTLSRMVADIFFVKRLARHIPIKNALIPIFVFRGKIGGSAFCNFVHIAAHRHVV